MTKAKFHKKTIKDVPIDGKTVLVRVDYNLPLNPDGTIADDYRIIQSLPTIEYLLKRDCKVVLCSHLGRPDGKEDVRFTLEPVAKRLRKLLKVPVAFVPAATGDRVNMSTKRLHKGHVVLLENLRFDPREEANDPEFAKALATDSNAQYFVQDGFGMAHRAHASMKAITQFLPSVSGLLVEREYVAIESAIGHPKRPFVAVLGGAKVHDKIQVIERFVEIADSIVIGGAMANTFLKYKGYDIGKSMHDKGQDVTIEKIYQQAKKKLNGHGSVDEFITLPVDVAVTDDPDNEKQRRCTVDISDVEKDEFILDVGPATTEMVAKVLQNAGTVVWNGTLGLAEKPQYSYGSARVALQLAQQKPDTVSVIGGGDTADFVLDWDMHGGESFSHVSTGGGASLDLMAGKSMPGIDSLLDA